MAGAPFSELKAEDKPDVGKGIAKVGESSYASEAELVADFALVRTRSETLREALAAWEALSASHLPGFDAERDRLLKSAYLILCGQALLTKEEPEVAAAASRLLIDWYPHGLAITKLRYAKESDAIHTLLTQAVDDVHQPLVETTQIGRIVGYVTRTQADFDGAAAGRPADVKRVKELGDVVTEAEERWGSAVEVLVAHIKEHWHRGTPAQEGALEAVYRPVRDAVAKLRGAVTRGRSRRAAATTADSDTTASPPTGTPE